MHGGKTRSWNFIFNKSSSRILKKKSHFLKMKGYEFHRYGLSACSPSPKGVVISGSFVILLSMHLA